MIKSIELKTRQFDIIVTEINFGKGITPNRSREKKSRSLFLCTYTERRETILYAHIQVITFLSFVTAFVKKEFISI